MIEIKDLTFSYNKKKKNVFNNLTININNGLSFIIGNNGVGKSTLMKLIMGILKPISGQIIVDGEDVSKKKLAQIGRTCGYLFQNPDSMLFANTVWEELTFTMELQKIDKCIIEERANSALKTFGLSGRENEFPLNLSLGQRQRLALATIFMREPRRYLLDEPTAMLDYSMKEDLYSLIKILIETGKDVIIATHDYDFVDRFKGEIINLSGDTND